MIIKLTAETLKVHDFYLEILVHGSLFRARQCIDIRVILAYSLISELKSEDEHQESIAASSEPEQKQFEM